MEPGQFAKPSPVRFRSLSDFTWLRHGITTREGPRLEGNVSFSRGPDVAAVVAARERWARRIGFDANSLVLARQVHGIVVDRVTIEHRGRGATAPVDLPAADALMTNAKAVPLMAVFADCVPIVLVDAARRAVAVVHAGWRGTVAGVTEAAVAAMSEYYGTSPSQVLAGVGPSIGPCCYAVGPDVAAAARDRFGHQVMLPGPAPDNPHLDLWACARQALTVAGVKEANIETLGLCTRCRNDLFFSHRAEGPSRGLFATIVGLI